jgi:hypothetical protein
MRRLSIVVLLLLVTSMHANAQSTSRQECKGMLQSREDGKLFIAVPPEGVCEINSSEVGKVVALCATGHFCRIYGWAESCKDSGECSEFTNVLRVRPK